MKTISPDTTIGVAREMAMEVLVEALGGFIKLGRFMRIRFVYNQNGLPDVPDEMTIREFVRLTAKNEAKIIVDDRGGGTRVKSPRPKAPTPELV